MRKTLLATCAAVAVACTPMLAAAADTAPDAAAGCLQDIQSFDRDLGTAGYGLAGPGGYGAWPSTAAATAPSATVFGYLATPRDQMVALRNAAFVLAMNGNQQGCEMLLGEMHQAFDDYRQQVAAGESVDPEEVTRWRAEWLRAATPVTEIEGPVAVSDVLGADLRGLDDEDLGDVDNVVLGDDGEIQFVTVARGGFLGIGDETVAIPWEALRLTPDPYGDTFVLPVTAEVLDNAPTVEVERLASETGWHAGVSAYWQEHAKGEAG